MSFINYEKQEMNCKILYCGPSLSGKSTNIKYIYDTIKASSVKKINIAKDSQETLLYDFLPINIGNTGGYETHFHLYSIPSHGLFSNISKSLFQGVDGLIFVADSELIRLEDNISNLKKIIEELEYFGKDIQSIPFIFQWNKRDLSNICSVKELSKNINTFKFAETEASANTGKGVFETLKLMMKFVLVNVKGQ